MSEYLITDPKARMERAKEKQQWVLDFLRDEIYSSTQILADVMCVEDRAARTTLDRLHKAGLLVRDEIRFMESRALTLWGITATGVLEGVEPAEIATMSLRHHEPGRVSPLTVQHTLDVQRCRLLCEGEALGYEDWTSGRLLPGQSEKRGHPARWAQYPDAVASAPVKDGKRVKVAIEVERTRKSPARYVQIIRGHLINIERQRYAAVIYFCPEKAQAEALKALFERLALEKKIVFVTGNGEHLVPSDKVISQFFRFRALNQ